MGINWDWGGAIQGGALGASGFAGGPIVGGITTAGGTLLGGLFGGGRGDVGAPPGYQVPEGTGYVGGYEVTPDVPTVGTENMTPEQLAQYRADNPERNIVGGMPALADNPMSEHSTAPWSVGEGRANIVTGNELMDQGLNMRGREPTAMDPTLVDPLRATADASGNQARWAIEDNRAAIDATRANLGAGLSGIQGATNAGVRGITDTMGADRARLGLSAAQDKIKQEAALQAGITGLEGQNALVGDQLAYMQAVQNGTAGSSLAEIQSRRMLGDQINNQMAMAKSGSSFNPAALRGAQMAGEQMSDAQRQQASELRAAEQMNARGQVNQLLGMGQQGEQGLANFRMGGAAGIGQFGLQGNQALADIGLQGNIAAGNLGLGGAQAYGNLGLSGNQAIYGMGANQANQFANLYGQDIGRTGQEMGWAQNNAAFADAQRNRDDAMRTYLSSLGMDLRGQGLGILQGQAQNDIALAGIQAGATGQANNLGFQTDVYNTGRADAQRDRTMQALGTALTGVGAMTGGGGMRGVGEGGGSTGVDTGGIDYAEGYGPQTQGTPSDPRTKEDLRSAEQQIEALTRALEGATSSEQRLAIAAGESPPIPARSGLPSVGRFPDLPDRRSTASSAATGVGQTLQALGGQQAPQWRYTDRAQAAFPDTTSPGTHVGYLTSQLKDAGPAGRSMVKRDPRTGYEVIDTPAATTFTLAATGQQQRQLDDQRRKLEDQQREIDRLNRELDDALNTGGSEGVLYAAGGY